MAISGLLRPAGVEEAAEEMISRGRSTPAILREEINDGLRRGIYAESDSEPFVRRLTEKRLIA